MTKRLLVVDVSSFIFRAFYAVRSLHSPDGKPVNAVFGVMQMILNLLSKYQPDAVVLARDVSGGSFRKEIYPEYKANRSAPPDDLIPQFELIDRLITSLQIPTLSQKGLEADDLIASVVTQYREKFDEVLIATGDKDLMQLVGGPVKMVDTMKDQIYGRDEVFVKMGVYPEEIVDYLSLVGDTSDNIPGVKGIGEKGAAKLIAEYKTLDEIIKNRDAVKNAKTKNALCEHAEDAYLSKRLITLKSDFQIPYSKEELQYRFTPSDALYAFLKELGFHSLIKKLKDFEFQDAQVSEAPKEIAKESHKFEFWKVEEVSVEPNIVIALKSEVEVLLPSLDLKKVIGHDLKNFFHYLYKKEIALPSQYDDLALMHYVLDPDGRQDLTFIQTTLQGEVNESADKIFEIYQTLYKKLEASNSYKLYEELERPLIEILFQMEKDGIAINSYFFKELEERFSKESEETTKEIETITGVSINLKSPKQVGELLFETLKLPVIKKTKTGYSTDVEVLEELRATTNHPVPGLLLKHRELEKLLSTYIKTLPTLVDEKTGRIHTHYNQFLTATGRLSSERPNIQNIPIKTENGRLIRRGFVASPGKLFLAVDYSQIELRILAHMSQDPMLVKAFNEGVDIHRQTAAEVLGISPEEVKSEDRSMAKAVNFGLIYGQGAFGLAASLGISRGKAKEYIDSYFAKFSSVREFMNSLKIRGRELGFSETLSGRRRYLKNINSSNHMIRSHEERLCINAPIQGTAADLIKLAMIKIIPQIKAHNLKAKLLLQVHDELIFELPEEELEELKSLVQSTMESVMPLTIPLKVSTGIGVNWHDVK